MLESLINVSFYAPPGTPCASLSLDQTHNSSFSSSSSSSSAEPSGGTTGAEPRQDCNRTKFQYYQDKGYYEDDEQGYLALVEAAALQEARFVQWYVSGMALVTLFWLCPLLWTMSQFRRLSDNFRASFKKTMKIVFPTLYHATGRLGAGVCI